ncbi:uncharacterized protein [Halyomorpha halys]|uniref:uncharacterized protein n=1 Tax=Halyomorpha halys TaxID=286706 RepID=UPI0006D50F00|nr:uncharacterized protein LOC106689137 [Halyomorpha halys]
MFWILKKSKLTNSAVAFFNNLNNNALSASTGTGYNKLGCTEESISKKHSTSQKTSSIDNLCNIADVDSDSSCSEVELEDDISQDSDYGETLTCNVCDRFFCTQNQLSAHQQKKRHFGCSSCDSLFSTLMALEHHKEEFEHWSGEDCCQSISENSDEDTTYEMERLL